MKITKVKFYEILTNDRKGIVNERLYLNCSVKFIYSVFNQINNSIQINIIHTVYMTAKHLNENDKSQVLQNTMIAKELSKESLETIL